MVIHARGFTYLGVLFAVAFLGLLLAKVGEHWQLSVQREREAELLFIGRQYAQALASYYAATPSEPRHYPRRLEDLLEDRRGHTLKRHLRRLYADPFTGKNDWVLIKSGEFIVGLHSRAEGTPLKQSGFAPEEEEFIGAARYSDWRFLARLQSTTSPLGHEATLQP